MDFEVIWSRQARTDVEGIVEYISQHNPSAAARVVKKVLNRVELLKVVPRTGRKYGQSEGQEIRWVVSGKYRIFFAADRERQRVEILTVWHASRQDPDLH